MNITPASAVPVVLVINPRIFLTSVVADPSPPEEGQYLQQELEKAISDLHSQAHTGKPAWVAVNRTAGNN